MSDKALREEITEVLEEIGPASQSEVAQATFTGRRRCPECDRYTDDYNRHASAVNEALVRLIDDNVVVTTADWDYKLRDFENKNPNFLSRLFG